MARVKIAIIGGGSYGWTHKIVSDLCLQEDLEGEIMLEDIDPEPLKLTAPLAKMISERAGGRFSVSSTTDQTEALTGADFMILTISTGRLKTMWHDVEIPRKYGIHQPVGDTVGPGGLSRALRNIPVIVNIAKEMERVCPNAWFFNYTNPMTTLTRAIYKYTSTKAIGLCHELFTVRDKLAQLFECDKDELDMVAAGVNHLIWLLRINVRGQDGFELMKEALAKKADMATQDEHFAEQSAFVDGWKAKLALFDIFDALPSAGDRHVVEFFPYFLTEHANQAADYAVKMTMMEDREKGYGKAAKRLQDWISGEVEYPMEQSREAVSKLISALANHKRGIVDIVNLPNRGQIPNLPMDAVVETMGLIGPYEATPLTVGPLPPPIQSICNTHVVNQELIVEAAMTGDRHLCLQALYNDPLVREFDCVPRMLEEMLEANREYLPMFFGN